jgi:hypothetical protein
VRDIGEQAGLLQGLESAGVLGVWSTLAQEFEYPLGHTQCIRFGHGSR